MNIWPGSYIPKILNRGGKDYNIAVIALLALSLTIAAGLSIALGSARLTPAEMLEALSGKDLTSSAYQIVRFVRLPRTLAAILAGCGLSVSGLVLQAVLNNSLAGPSVIGVNSGAGLFTVLMAAFFPGTLQFAPAAAFVGALTAALLVYFIAQKTGASRMAIVLSGTAVSSFIGAITDTVLTVKPDTAISRTEFLIGGLSGIVLQQVKIPSLIILTSIFALILLGYDMNVLALGDETAKSLGMKVPLYRFLFLALAALLAGSAVSFAGLIGFVGLIIPHAARFLVGYDNRVLVPVCALLGGVFSLFCDILSRTLFAPYEVPVGIIMSFLGGPFFVVLLLRQKRGRLYD
jgi:iron complex transport system permease protein